MGKKTGLSIGTETTIKVKQWLTAVQRELGPALESNNNEFDEKVRQELDDNPALEKVEDNDNDINTKDEDGRDFTDDIRPNSGDDDDDAAYRSRQRNARNSGPDDDDDSPRHEVVAEKSLADDLMEQMGEQRLTDRQRVIAQYVIGSLSDDGYLKSSSMDIADDITFNSGLDIEVDDDEVEAVTQMLRRLDPPGIGARDLRDCLLLQLRRLPKSAATELATGIVGKLCDGQCSQLAKPDRVSRIAKATGRSAAEVEQAMGVIVKLNPKPGNAYSGSARDIQQQQISPDFIVEVDDHDKVTITLTNSIPELQVSESYQSSADYFKGHKPRSTQEADQAKLVKQQSIRAMTFIEVVKRRQHTLFNVMKSIASRQHGYILSGDDADLQPMTLKDVAADTGLDVSVVSRACNGKYASMPWGIKSLKSFFSEGIKTSDGGTASARVVQSALRQIVDGEDKAAPMSDEELSRQLKERGYSIARRTVSKYRELLKIPSANMRRKA